MNGETTVLNTRAVLRRVFAERLSQEKRYGHVNPSLSSGTGPDVRWLGSFTGLPASEVQKALRRDYEEYEDETGNPTWLHLVREEICEAFEVPASDPERLAEELIQVAALCVSWVERLGVVPVPSTLSWDPDADPDVALARSDDSARGI